MTDDPYLWLEDITGDDALDWVREHNEPTIDEFSDERFEQMRTEALEVLDTDARIPYVRRRGEYLYNFWRDAANPRGLWRRTTLDSYRTDDPDWDVIIDVDELARADGENWVWAGADVIEPDHTLALISLSRGGSDAAVVREFDMATARIRRRRLRAAGGQVADVTWEDHDTVLVGTDFGPGSLTESGYPRIVKRWRRGPAAERGDDGVHRARHRRHRVGVGGPHAGLRAHPDAPRPSTSSTSEVYQLRSAASWCASTHPPTPRCRCTATGC